LRDGWRREELAAGRWRVERNEEAWRNVGRGEESRDDVDDRRG
jgi:hypothetical protein